MNGRFLLDTNIVIAYFDDQEPVVQGVETANEVFVPAIVIGELSYGARNSKRAQENLDRIMEFQDAVSVLPVNAATAHHYGQIKNSLRARGRPVPENDIWIAALAVQHGLPLVSRDGHFADVEGLELIQWQPSPGTP